MRVSARADYALRAATELAVAGPGERLKRDALAERQDIPVDFLQHILLALKHAGIVHEPAWRERRVPLGPAPAVDISLADVIRAVDGPMANVRGERAEPLVTYNGPAQHLREVWIAVRASLRDILESTSVRDLVEGTLSAPRRAADSRAPDAWVSPDRPPPTAVRPRPPTAKRMAILFLSLAQTSSTSPQRRRISTLQETKDQQVDGNSDDQHHEHRGQQPLGVRQLARETAAARRGTVAGR